MGEMTIGTPLDQNAIAQLTPGESSSSDVSEIMGAPIQVVELGNKSAWLYEAQTARQAGIMLFVFGTFGQDRQSDRCWVFFDEDGTLSHVAVTLDGDKAEYKFVGND